MSEVCTCGSEIAEGAKFCCECGKPLNGTDKPPRPGFADEALGNVDTAEFKKESPVESAALGLKILERPFKSDQRNILKVKIANLLTRSLGRIECLCTCDAFFKEEIKKDIMGLGENVSKEFQLSFKPIDCGELLVEFELIYLDENEKPNVLKTEFDLIVKRGKGTSSGNLNIEIGGDAVISGRGLSIRDEDDDLTGRDRSAGKWRDLKLTYDFERTKQYQDKQFRKEIKKAEDQPADPGPRPGLSPMNWALLSVVRGGPECKIMLYAKERIQLGRSKGDTDISCRLLKEDGTLDRRNSTCVSRRHVELIAKSNRVFIQDTGSKLGTKVGRTPLKPMKPRTLKNLDVIMLAGVLRLAFMDFRDYDELVREAEKESVRRLTDFGTRIDGLGIDSRRHEAPLRSYKLTRLDNLRGRLSYAVVLREADIGSDDGNCIVIKGDGVSEIHATLVYREGKFFLMDRKSVGGTVVNGKPLVPFERYLLSGGDRIAFGDTQVEFEMK